MSLVVDLFSIVAIGAGVFFFLAGTVGLLRFPDALSRLHALTKADNLGLGLDRARPSAARREPARRAQARRHLGAGAIGRRDRGAARRARGAAQGNGRMSVLQALDIGLAFLVFAVAAWTIFAPGAFAATVGYVVYGLLAVARLDTPVCGRCGADGGGDRQRRDRRSAHRRRRAAARSGDAGRKRNP